jgi:hypothetical protein
MDNKIKRSWVLSYTLVFTAALMALIAINATIMSGRFSFSTVIALLAAALLIAREAFLKKKH